MDPSSLLGPLQRVLVASDFTDGAEAALLRALRLPLAPDARVHLVHVLPILAREDAQARARAALVEALARGRAAAGPGGEARQWVPEVLQGSAYVELIGCARRSEAELVVLGRHGQRPVRDMFLGSTAERVARKGDSSAVLVVRRPPEAPYARVLVGSDLGDGGRAALALALRVAGRDVRRLDVLHALDVPFTGLRTPWPSPTLPGEDARALEDEATRELEAQLAPLVRAQVPAHALVRTGEARVSLVAEATRGQHDLLVVASHTRAGVAHALLGSVAAWCVASSPCDVLVARTPGVTVSSP